MSTLTKTPSRVAKWDNTKAFLILTVVLGHSMSAFLDNGSAMHWMEICLYSFHMPLFIFIGGLFSKRTINSTPFKYDKVVTFLLLNLFMKLLTYLTTLAFKGKATFRLLSDNSVSWYIFAMAAHLIITYLLRNCDHKKIFAASIVVGLLAGYVGEIANTLVLSRIIVFYPFFYLGYALDSEQVLRVVNKPAVRIGSLIFLIAVFVAVYVTIDTSYSLRALLTGNNPYKEFGKDVKPYGGLLRAGTYLLSFTTSFAVLSIMPNKHLPLVTYCGKNTLQVYALHRTVQRILGYLVLYKLLRDTEPVYLLPILLGISIALVLVLSTKPFGYLLYPCTKWQVWLSPVINWFKKKEWFKK